MLKKCPFCKKETYDHAATKYCMYCARDLTINTCSNTECFVFINKEVFPKEAVRCPVCGAPTVLHSDEGEGLPF
jgi:hypothetical protein